MLWQPRYTVAVLQGIRFETATNGAPVCAYYVGVPFCEHNEGSFQPTLPLNFKHIRTAVTLRFGRRVSPSRIISDESSNVCLQGGG